MWNIVFEDGAKQDLKKLGSAEQIRISVAIAERIAVRDNPRTLGEALTGRFKGLWKYRVGDYRVIGNIEDYRVLILIVKIGNRREVYK